MKGDSSVCYNQYPSYPFDFNFAKHAADTKLVGNFSIWQWLTWFPKTPMLHALLTWSGPNQTAAKRAGTDSTNAWLTATNVWPTKVIQNRSGLTLNTFIQEPSVVPIAPAKAANLSPWNQRFILFIFCKKKKEKYYKVNNWTKDFFQNFVRQNSFYEVIYQEEN